MIGVLLAALAATSQPSPESGPKGILEQALSCRLGQDELGGLIAGIRQEFGAGMALKQSYAAPGGDLFLLARPVAVQGFTSREVYLQPGRVAVLVDRPLADVSAALHLEADEYGPSSRPAGENRSIVAWQLHQTGLSGKTLVGCEYRDASAALWLDQADNSPASG